MPAPCLVLLPISIFLCTFRSFVLLNQSVYFASHSPSPGPLLLSVCEIFSWISASLLSHWYIPQFCLLLLVRLLISVTSLSVWTIFYLFPSRLLRLLSVSAASSCISVPVLCVIASTSSRGSSPLLYRLSHTHMHISISNSFLMIAYCAFFQNGLIGWLCAWKDQEGQRKKHGRDAEWSETICKRDPSEKNFTVLLKDRKGIDRSREKSIASVREAEHQRRSGVARACYCVFFLFYFFLILPFLSPSSSWTITRNLIQQLRRDDVESCQSEYNFLLSQSSTWPARNIICQSMWFSIIGIRTGGMDKRIKIRSEKGRVSFFPHEIIPKQSKRVGRILNHMQITDNRATIEQHERQQ